MALFNEINDGTIGQLLSDAGLIATGTFLDDVKLYSDALQDDALATNKMKEAQANFQAAYTPYTPETIAETWVYANDLNAETAWLVVP